MSYLPAISRGFMTGASLIIAIGAQNAFVLRQGVTKNYVFTTALICSLLDAFLIMIGISGIGKLLTEYVYLIPIARWGGSIFLIVYATLCLKAAISKTASLTEGSHTNLSLKALIISLCSISLLNPHVYLDTVILLGSIASSFPEKERILFTAGAILASFSWFFSLAFGGKKLSPILGKPSSWRILNLVTAIMMISIALSLMTSN